MGGRGVRVGTFGGVAKKRGGGKLLGFHKNTVVTDSANTAAPSFLLFMVKW